jgi:hypothetical protein
MDPFHERLARVALRAAGQYGFALAGGYAIQAHGFLDRLSADADLIAPSSVEADFTTAVDAVVPGIRKGRAGSSRRAPQREFSAPERCLRQRPVQG